MKCACCDVEIGERSYVILRPPPLPDNEVLCPPCALHFLLGVEFERGTDIDELVRVAKFRADDK